MKIQFTKDLFYPYASWLKVGFMQVGSNFQKSEVNMDLTFFYPSLGAHISTDILEIETYSNNFVVSPAIGNLVVYTSDERQVPCLAKTWKREGLSWIFDLREGVLCENGEEITAQGFAKSLARSIRLYSSMGEHPIFQHLVGYEQLIESRLEQFNGVLADGSKLVFNFTTPVQSGFLEHLGMAPFGYICDENFVGDRWKDPTRIVSSGAYSLEPISQHDSYTLYSRANWPSDLVGDLQKIVILREGMSAFEVAKGPRIIEVANPSAEDFVRYKSIRQTLHNLIVVKLNTQYRAFADQSCRAVFQEIFRKHLKKFKLESTNLFKAEHFFAEGKSILKRTDVPTNYMPPKGLKLLAKVMDRGVNSPNNIIRQLLLLTSNDIGWEIEFNSDPYNSFREEFNDPKYDVYVQAAEIGLEFEGWVVDMLFHSDIGNYWPDPSGKIHQLTREYEEKGLSKAEAAQRLQDYIIEDAALIPVFHCAGAYFFSGNIDVESLPKMVTRIRFDEIKADNPMEFS